MPSNKAPGIDKVPTRVLKDSLLITLPFITSIINASLLASTFPEVWKTAEITPIPKQGNHELPNNNRPISLLHALSKVCERVAYNQFVNRYFLRFLISPLDLTAHNRAAWTKLTNRITGKSQYIPRKLGVDPNRDKQYRPKSTNYNLKGPLA